VTGACARGVDDAGIVTAVRFASGVHVTWENGVTIVMRVTNPDGTACYSLELSRSPASGTIYTWKDSAGNVVATGQESNGTQITCANGDQTPLCYGSGRMSTCCLDDFGNPPDPAAHLEWPCLGAIYMCPISTCP
jgi:hypothetical protein